MALIQRYKKFALQNKEEYFNDKGERNERMPGEPRRVIEGALIVDYSCFAKTKKEKEILKLAKLQSKLDELKKRR